MQEENMIQPEETQAVEPILPEESQVDKKSEKMKVNLNTIFNIVLLIAVIVLFILHFTTPKPEPPALQVTAALQKSGSKPISIVFVNIDSLNDKYEFIKKLKGDLENSGKKLQSEVLAEQSALEKEAADFQKQVASNSIPEEKAKAIYESLMQKQQALMEKKDRYTQQVGNQELAMNMRLLDTVTNFLKRYNRTYKFDYILAHKTAGDILVGNDTLDITSDVIRQLNKEYNARKK